MLKREKNNNKEILIKDKQVLNSDYYSGSFKIINDNYK